MPFPPFPLEARLELGQSYCQRLRCGGVRFKVMRRFANRWSLGKWRQRHSATGRYWQFFRRPLKFAFRFASITITVANSEGNLKEAAVIENSRITINPQRECTTLDRTLWKTVCIEELPWLIYVLWPT